MTTVYPLVQMITNLTVLAPALTPWEICTLKLVQEDQPASVSFICKSDQHCPINSFYRKLKVPTQTILGVDTNDLPSFHQNDIVFIVDDNVVTWNHHAIRKYRLWGRNNFKVVVVAIGNNFERDLRSMEDLFAAMWLSGIVRCAVLLVNSTFTQTYTYVPFKGGASCEDTSPVLVGECSEGIDKVFDQAYKIFNLHRCSLRIATSQGIPILDELGSSEKVQAELIYEITNRMNSTIKSVIPEGGSYGTVCGPAERTGLRGLVLNGTVHVAVGRFAVSECATLVYIGAGYMHCESWCTPVLSANDYVYFFLLKQLTLEVWIALVLSVLIVSVSVLFLCKASLEDWTANDIFHLALAVFAQTPRAEPLATPARMVVVVWLWACLIFRAAFEGEMKSQSAVQQDTHIIADLEELSNTDLLLCSSSSAFQILQDVDNPIIQKLLKKVEVCHDDFYRLAMKAARQKNRGVLMAVDTCLDAASLLSQDEGSLYPKTGGCLKTFEMSPVAVLRGSPFKSTWRALLLRLFEAGLISRWFDKKLPQRYSSGARALSFAHISPAMFAFVVGCLGGFLLFVGEKIYYKWFQRKPKVRDFHFRFFP